MLQNLLHVCLLSYISLVFVSVLPVCHLSLLCPVGRPTRQLPGGEGSPSLVELGGLPGGTEQGVGARFDSRWVRSLAPAPGVHTPSSQPCSLNQRPHVPSVVARPSHCRSRRAVAVTVWVTEHSGGPVAPAACRPELGISQDLHVSGNGTLLISSSPDHLKLKNSRATQK